MDKFLHHTSADRRRFCEEASITLGLQAASVEKDFWVCWTLHELFALPDFGARLTFKGGTSLSKCWKLIERFSEDIDVVIDRDFLGFGGGNAPESAPSHKQRAKRLEDLKAACQNSVRQGLQPALQKRLQVKLPKGFDWTLTNDPDDVDQQTLLFQYPTVFPSGGYLRPVVKIELGARSDTEPSEIPEIRLFLAEALPAEFKGGVFKLRAVAPERTFWEKAMLLHEETYRSGEVKPKARLASHNYGLR